MTIQYDNLNTQISSVGSAANIPIVFQTKGTGALDFSAGSTGINISNGNTVTAITRTAIGSGYTTPPSVAISAPNIAGGTQATATCVLSVGATLVSGGTGYTAGDVLTVSGGTSTTAAQITVSTVSGGVITAITVSNAGVYTALPTNPVSVTGGTGSSATFNLSGFINATFTITNAGSGYVEQPTVTFSGGGGSGAAAYASVGSATTVRHLVNFLSFTGPSGISFAVNAASGTVANYIQAASQSTGNFPSISAVGGDTNIGLDLFSKGTSPIRGRTGTGSAEQFRIADTASAVNYVQVTGGATGTPAVVTISGQGSSSNIDMALTPKGTGVLRFGTHTGVSDTAISGYIEIKDSGGTTRKLAVIT